MSINNISTVGGQNAPQVASVIRQSTPAPEVEKAPEQPPVTESVQRDQSAQNAQSDQSIKAGSQDNPKGLSLTADKQAEQKISAQNVAQDQAEKEVKSLMESLQQAATDNAYQSSSLNIRKLEFSTAQESGRTIVKVIDKENNDVIRQIPSEEFIRSSDKISELSQQGSAKPGLLFDSKV